MRIWKILSGIFLLLPWSGLLAAPAPVDSAGQEESFPDIDRAQLSALGKVLGCPRPDDPAARQGCDILSAFAGAKAPDPRVLKDSEGLQGRRWLGVAVVMGAVAGHDGEVSREVPYVELVVLGARGGNFHQNLYYRSGYSVNYIWPTRDQEISLIESAADSLGKGLVDRENPAVRFASKAELEYDAAQPSQGKSLLIGRPDVFLRQKGNTLYVLEKGKTGAFLLSKVSLDNLLK